MHVRIRRSAILIAAVFLGLVPTHMGAECVSVPAEGGVWGSISFSNDPETVADDLQMCAEFAAAGKYALTLSGYLQYRWGDGDGSLELVSPITRIIVDRWSGFGQTERETQFQHLGGLEITVEAEETFGDDLDLEIVLTGTAALNADSSLSPPTWHAGILWVRPLGPTTP